MTDSLKEEIFEIIREKYAPKEYYIVANKVDEILKLFEKRVDELMDKSSKYEWVHALMEVKKELLK